MEKLCRRSVSWWRERVADKAIVEYAPRFSMWGYDAVVAEVRGRNVRMDHSADWLWIPDLEARIKPA